METARQELGQTFSCHQVRPATADVSFWPVADVALCPRFGRYQRKSGHDVEPREATRRYSVPLGLGREERRAGLRMISRYRQ
jgi:hypothetical protein